MVSLWVNVSVTNYNIWPLAAELMLMIVRVFNKSFKLVNGNSTHSNYNKYMMEPYLSS